MSKFFETTIVSTYIKYLLENNPLPLYPVINTDQVIVEGCTYIYRHNIIKCTKTGIFKGLNANIYTDDYLYVNEQLLVTDDDEVQERRSTDWVPIYKDKELVDYLNANGYDAGEGSVTKDTDILIVPSEGYNSGSKYNKAVQYGITIKPINQFKEELGLEI